MRYSLSSRTGNFQTYIFKCFLRVTQRQFSENICSEDNLRSRIFGTFVVKFLGFLPLLEFLKIYKKCYNCPCLTDFYPKKDFSVFSCKCKGVKVYFGAFSFVRNNSSMLRRGSILGLEPLGVDKAVFPRRPWRRNGTFKFGPCVNVCFTVGIFSVAVTEIIFNFLKRY